MRTILPLALLLPGCVLDVGLGPDLGACADYPDGPYTFGEAGIGTCLAGPSDLQFYTGLGGTWLAVTNADPFHNYLTGSLLLISMRDIAEDLRNDRFSPDQLVRDVRVDQLDAHALPMDSFVGAFAFDPLRPGLALVPSRLSADSLLTTEPDKLWLVDVSDPRAPRYAEPRAFLTVRQDPFTVRTSGDFAFVLSPTDDSIAVVDLRADPPELYDPAPESRIGDVTFSDADASGSRSELVATPFPASEIPSTETWTAAWIEGSTRLWVPEESGLARYAWGGAGEVPPARGGLGVELDPEPSLAITSVDDAFFVDNGEALSLHVPSGRTVYAAWWQPDFAVWAWDAASELRLPDDAWADRTGGPTLTEVGGRTLMFFDGALEGDPATAIGIATTTDGIRFSALDEPVIAPDGPWSRLAQPTVLGDPFAGDAAMWMSAWDGARWVVATSRSADGLTGWSTPEQALAVDGEDAGAPHVGWAAGRFRMWLTVSRGGAWWYATSESADGRVWSAPELHLEGPAITGDEDRPPRAAIQHVPTAAWRIEGSNTGPLDDLAFEAFATTDPATGATLRFASGAIIGTDIAGLLSRNGVEPGSWAEVAGVPTLYVTAIGADGRQRLMALRQAGDAWGVRASDLIPDGSGGNVLGVRAPTVFAVPGGWRMLYAAWGADGSWRIHQAASPDGVTWEPEGEALTSPPPWATSEQVPHAVEATDDGWRAWFAGGESGRLRIATMTSPDGATWTFEDVALEPGDPGTFDDRSVSDPMPARCGGVDGLWYTADDGERLAIGFAARADGAWQRWQRPVDGVASAVLGPTLASFAGVGVRGLVAVPGDEPCAAFIAGSDGAIWRTGQVVLRGPTAYPAWSYPTQGDVTSFATFRGEPGTSTIDLGQIVDGVRLPGWDGKLTDDGPSGATLDTARGLLFIVSKSNGLVIVVDVRDDSTSTWRDINYLDIEAVLRFPTPTGSLGFYDAVLGPNNRLYLAAREPEGVMVVDTTALVDDAVKDVVDNLPQGIIPTHDLNDDAGEASFAAIGLAGLALVPGQDLLLATHFRDNALSIIDLDVGLWGEEIRYLQDIGENPHQVRVSPDGTYAVIANYLGAVSNDAAGSSLSILDLQPSSQHWLQITKRIVNK